MLIERGLSDGWLFVDERDIYYCMSGRIEFLAVEEALHENNNDRTLYYVKDGIPYSSITQTPLIKEKRPCLMLKLPDLKPTDYQITVTPNYGRAEFFEHLKSYAGREILISRINPHKPLVGLFQHKIETSLLMWIFVGCHI